MNQNKRFRYCLIMPAVVITALGLTAHASESVAPPKATSSVADTTLLALEGSRRPEDFDSDGIDTHVDNKGLDTRKATDGIDRDGIDTEGIDPN